MNKLFLLLLLPVLLLGCIHKRVCFRDINPPSHMCQHRAGAYKFLVVGTFPRHKSEIEKHLCPLDIFVGDKQHAVIFLSLKDPRLLCGKSTQGKTGEDTFLEWTTTTESITGFAILWMNIDNLRCILYYRVSLKKL